MSQLNRYQAFKIEKAVDPQTQTIKQDKHGNTVFNAISPVGRPVTMLADHAAELNAHSDNTLIRYELAESKGKKTKEG